MKHLNQLLTASAAEWGVTFRTAAWIFWLPLVGAVLVAAARLNKDLYRFLLQEDGPVEWAQFIFFSLACVSGVGVAIQRFRAGHRWQALLYVGFALAVFFVAGEEIAWGQRLLDWETPKALKDINLQGETTLHNIRGVLGKVDLVMMLAGAYGAVAFFLNQRVHVEQYGDHANYLLVPPFFLSSAFLLVFLYRLFHLVVWRQSGFTITKYGEWPELCLAFGFFAFAWLNYRRLAAERKSALVGDQEKVITKGIK